MKNFKFLSGNSNYLLTRYGVTTVNPNFYSTISVTNTNNTNNQFCFQFNDSEPIVFGNGQHPLSLTINDNTSNITFTDNNNNTFTLFSRPNENI
jgi:hypothetical protein